MLETDRVSGRAGACTWPLVGDPGEKAHGSPLRRLAKLPLRTGVPLFGVNLDRRRL